MTPKTTAYILLLAALLSSIGVYFAYSHIQSVIEQHKSATVAQSQRPPEPKIQLVGLKQRTNAGTLLSIDAIKPINVPFSIASKYDYIYWEDRGDIFERRLLVDLPIHAGIQREEISASHLNMFSDQLESHDRAMTIPADSFQSVFGYVQPKDKIDLLLVTNEAHMPKSIPLAQQIEVLATDTLTEPNLALPTLPNSGEISSLTIRVTPIQAQRISLGMSLGDLVVLLRNEKDNANRDTQQISSEVLLPKAPKIELIVGGV